MNLLSHCRKVGRLTFCPLILHIIAFMLKETIRTPGSLQRSETGRSESESETANSFTL